MASKGLIIVIEDDANTRGLLKKILKSEGFMTLEYSSAEQGMQAILTQRPRLVLCDINLPGISGVELCQRGRAHLNGVPWLFLTGEDDIVTLKQALEAGANDYLLKRQGPKSIVQRINYWLGPAGRQPHHELISRAIAKLGGEIEVAEAALSSATNKDVKAMSAHIAAARSLAGDFGQTVEEKLYLLGYVTGVVTDKANSETHLNDRFNDYLEAVLKETGVLSVTEVSHMMTSLEELETAKVFKIGKEYGEEDAEERRIDNDYVPEGLACFEDALQG